MPAYGCPPVVMMPTQSLRPLCAWLQGATAPVALALHVDSVLRGAVEGLGGECKTYVAIRMHKLLESTWWLIAGHPNAHYWIKFDRNAVGSSGSTGS